MGLCHRRGRSAWEKKKGDKDIPSVEKGVVFALERKSVLGLVSGHMRKYIRAGKIADAEINIYRRLQVNCWAVKADSAAVYLKMPMHF